MFLLTERVHRLLLADADHLPRGLDEPEQARRRLPLIGAVGSDDGLETFDDRSLHALLVFPRLMRWALSR